MTVHHRTRSPRVLLALASVVAAVGVTPATAAADPPALNRDPCVTVMARAASWPGEGPGGIRLVSDAYVSFLAGQPECAAVRR